MSVSKRMLSAGLRDAPHPLARWPPYQAAPKSLPPIPAGIEPNVPLVPDPPRVPLPRQARLFD